MFNVNELSKEFNEVEKLNDVPLIICRWGIKKVKVDGKIFLAAMSPEEELYARQIPNTAPGSSIIEDLSASFPHCLTTNGWCQPQGGCKKCEVKLIAGNKYKCDCIDT